MSGLVRIRSESPHVRQLLQRWQQRFDVSGAVYHSEPSTLLLTTETSVEALEELVRSLEGNDLEVDIIWRDGDLLLA